MGWKLSPLFVAFAIPMLSGVVAIVTSAWALYAAVVGETVPGWGTIMIAVALAASAQLIMTGILGENIGRIYGEVKRRPLYVVAETLNLPPIDGTSATLESAAVTSQES